MITYFVIVIFFHTVFCINEKQEFHNIDDVETDYWVIKLVSNADPHRIAEQHGTEFHGRVGQLSDYYIYLKKPGTSTNTLAC